MGFTKTRPKERYNRKDVFITHENVALLTMYVNSIGLNLTAFLHDMVADKANELRSDKKQVEKLIKAQDERTRKAAKG